jgi:hypothetical protein
MAAHWCCIPLSPSVSCPTSSHPSNAADQLVSLISLVSDASDLVSDGDGLLSVRLLDWGATARLHFTSLSRSSARYPPTLPVSALRLAAPVSPRLQPLSPSSAPGPPSPLPEAPSTPAHPPALRASITGAALAKSSPIPLTADEEKWLMQRVNGWEVAHI